MVSIDYRQKIRAQITLGDELGGLVVSTPNVVSFSVRRARNQPAATFSASLRVTDADINSIGVGVVIAAGVKGSLQTIFTGVVEKAVMNPIKTDASMVMLNISGRDCMRVLDGQKVNRRLKTYRSGDTPPERYGVVSSIVKHNTSKVEKFKVRIEDNKPKATQEILKQPPDTTPRAFRINKDIDRKVGSKTEGGIEVTKLLE